MEDTDSTVTVSTADFTAKFNKKTGHLSGYSLNNEQIIKAPLTMNFWRAQTDNDRIGWRTHETLAFWKTAAEKLSLTSFSVKQLNAQKIKITTIFTIDNQLKVMNQYQINSQGEITVLTQVDADKTLPPMPRIGMTMGVSSLLTDVQYYGRGPYENYVDRNKSAEIDIYKADTSELPFSYMVPQENGNRTDIDWWKITQPTTQYGVMIDGDENLSMSMWPWSQSDLDKAKHPYDLTAQGFNTLNIDHRQMGVGGTDSWTTLAAPIKVHQIPAGLYTYQFTIVPVTP